MPKENPTAIIKNNTGADVPVTLFHYAGIPSSNNATRQFRYSAPASVFLNATRVSIQVRGSSSQAYQTYTAPISELTAQAVVNALNGLNLGTSWYTRDISGTPHIITDNDVLQFGDLTLDDPDARTVNFDFDVSDAGGLIDIDAEVNNDTVNVVNAVPPIISTFSQNFSAGVVFDLAITAPATTILRLLVTKITSAGSTAIITQIINAGQTGTAQFQIASDAISYTVSVEQPEYWEPLQAQSTPGFGIYETDYFPENAPLPPFTYDETIQAYFWIESIGGVVVGGSDVIPYSTIPAGFNLSSIAQWIFDTILAETGDAPAGDPLVDPPVTFFNGWGSAEDVSNTVTMIGNGYDMGNMQILTGSEKVVGIKFSKFT